MTTAIKNEPFGQTPDGKPVTVFTLRNATGAEARITNYGGIVVALTVPDRDGSLADVALGFDQLDDYIASSPYFGALIGRFGNRIDRGRFTLEGTPYELVVNNEPNHLHGGVKGFDKVVWAARPFETNEGPSLELTYLSPDGEEGYPGNLSVTCTYTLTHSNTLRCAFTATTDRTTLVNLTHHSYFNLTGQGDILNHEVMIPADYITGINKDLIPTGQLMPVADTPLDFRAPTQIGARINESHDQLTYAGGYDHNYVINKAYGALDLCARVVEPGSGRIMDVYSDQPGMQFYSGNFLDGTLKGKGGTVYEQRSGFCMEPQHFPDSPNHPDFPSTVVRPGQTYACRIEYRFSTR